MRCIGKELARVHLDLFRFLILLLFFVLSLDRECVYIKVDREAIRKEKRPVATEVKEANEIN